MIKTDDAYVNIGGVKLRGGSIIAYYSFTTENLVYNKGGSNHSTNSNYDIWTVIAQKSTNECHDDLMMLID